VFIALWFREWRRWLEVGLAAALAAVVAFAVWGAFGFGSSADEAADALQHNADRTVAALNLETERLRAANLELEASLSARIFRSQKAAIEALGRFAPVRTRIEYPPGNCDDCEATAEQICVVLHDARWHCSRRSGFHGTLL
jgi:hypothetical protein